VSQALAYLDQYDAAEPTPALAPPVVSALADGPDFESLVPDDYLADAPPGLDSEGPADESPPNTEDPTGNHLRSTAVTTKHHGRYRSGATAPRDNAVDDVIALDKEAEGNGSLGNRAQGNRAPGAGPQGTAAEAAEGDGTAVGAAQAEPGTSRPSVEPARQWSDIIDTDPPIPSALMPTDVPLPPPVPEGDVDGGRVDADAGKVVEPSAPRGLRGVAAAFSRLVGSGTDTREPAARRSHARRCDRS